MNKVFTKDELSLYFTGGKKHSAYLETVKQYEKINCHANGLVPGDLIKKRRPRESEEILKYRTDIYIPKTKHPIYKVINSLSKIRRSPDWSINYDKVESPARIIPEESLQTYCEEEYPGFTSVTNWMFSVALKNICIDANAVIAVFPVDPNIASNQFYKPMAMLFNSPEVIYFEETANYAVLKSKEKNKIVLDSGKFEDGDVYYIITDQEFFRYEKQMSGEFLQTQYINHKLGRLPVFKVPSVFLTQKDNVVIQESRIAPMIPHLDEAAREYSDLQASKVQHMFPLFWYIDTKKCDSCQGTGKEVDQSDPNKVLKKCSKCNGSGKAVFSPYVNMAVKPPEITEGVSANLPFPPAGYIAKDVEILKLQEESVDKNLFGALSSINMQFLDQTPLNISGEAKNVDREELNNFVYSVAEDIVACMDKIYDLICLWRYSYIAPNKADRKKMLPQIAVPEQFDLLPASYLMDEISKATSSKGVSPIIIMGLQKEYAVKKFYNNPGIGDLLATVCELDPLPGLTDDEKMIRLSNHGISMEDYVISSNLLSFVKMAVFEDKNFMGLDYSKQIDKMKEYAKVKMKDISGATEIKNSLNDQPIINQA
ncbi:hypothetical protein QTN47_17035 [Danxiaibacter flavus]|uniref:Phage portal protein n=1 Tax=Danxiaibacter flavus TaxID=3049108 RepID=A0ABV3ZH40_9BACT|nr:hypothetical protein QNM32_17045 [Chitinophagaceae bacterium DXS]